MLSFDAPERLIISGIKNIFSFNYCKIRTLFRNLQVFFQLFPKRMILPSARESHITHIDIWIFGKQFFKVHLKICLGIDCLQKKQDYAERVINLRALDSLDF